MRTLRDCWSQRWSSLFLAICLTMASGASAEWQCSHGTVGRLHDPSLQDVAAVDKLSYAWGMGYQQIPNATNWIIFSVPAVALTETRGIAINLETVPGGDLVVDRVAVWSGGQKLVDDLIVDWSGPDLGWRLLDLESDLTVISLSISLRTSTRELGGMVKVYSVCAQSL